MAWTRALLALGVLAGGCGPAGASGGAESSTGAGSDGPGSTSGDSGSADTSSGGGAVDLPAPDPCGNGELDPGEACDDGDDVNGDGCNIDCTVSGDPVWAVNWDGAMGLDDAGMGVAVDGEGNVVVTGTTNLEHPYLDGFVGKTDADGVKLWQAEIDHAGNGDSGLDVATDSAGNVGVAGWFRGAAGTGRYWSRYTNPDGAVIWDLADESTPIEQAYAIDFDAQGNLVTVGVYFGSDAEGGLQTRLRKFDPSGRQLLDIRHDAEPGAGFDTGYGLEIDADDNMAVVAMTGPQNLPSTIWWGKFSPSGAKLYEHRRDVPESLVNFKSGLGMCLDRAGNIVLAIYSFDDWKLLRMDSAGEIVSSHLLFDRPAAVACDTLDDAVVVVGSVDTDEGQTQAWVYKYAETGDELWHWTSEDVDAQAQDVAVDAADAILLAGSAAFAPPSHDIWLMKLTP